MNSRFEGKYPCLGLTLPNPILDKTTSRNGLGLDFIDQVPFQDYGSFHFRACTRQFLMMSANGFPNAERSPRSLPGALSAVRRVPAPPSVLASTPRMKHDPVRSGLRKVKIENKTDNSDTQIFQRSGPILHDPLNARSQVG